MNDFLTILITSLLVLLVTYLGYCLAVMRVCEIIRGIYDKIANTDELPEDYIKGVLFVDDALDDLRYPFSRRKYVVKDEEEYDRARSNGNNNASGT